MSKKAILRHIYFFVFQENERCTKFKGYNNLQGAHPKVKLSSDYKTAKLLKDRKNKAEDFKIRLMSSGRVARSRTPGVSASNSQGAPLPWVQTFPLVRNGHMTHALLRVLVLMPHTTHCFQVLDPLLHLSTHM